MEQQQRAASGRACFAQLETFFFGGTSTSDDPVEEAPEIGNLMSLVDFIKEEDLIDRPEIFGSRPWKLLDSPSTFPSKGTYLPPVLPPAPHTVRPLRCFPSSPTPSNDAHQLVEFSRYLQRLQDAPEVFERDDLILSTASEFHRRFPSEVITSVGLISDFTPFRS